MPNPISFILLLATLLIFPTAMANEYQLNAERNQLEKTVEREYTPITPSNELPELVSSSSALDSFNYTREQLQQNKPLTEFLLNQAVNSGNPDLISYLLNIYQHFESKDTILIRFAQAQIANKQHNYRLAIKLLREILAERPDLNPIRIQLGITLFKDQQDDAAKDQFEKAMSDTALPEDIKLLIHQYLMALESRNSWKIALSVNYLNEKNVNNVSSERYLENTPFIKGESMLPQQAQGIAYNVALEKDFNLRNAHYLHFENNLNGKNYWNNHNFDEIINRTYLGYKHKSERQYLAILPFYEQQWYGNHRYKRSLGGRVEFNYWLNSHWQFSTALEYGENIYRNNYNLNGNSKLVSTTLLLRVNPRTFFYTGIDQIYERTKERSYSYDLTAARLGWGQEWQWGISTRLSASMVKKYYKANLSLGRSFHFDKHRQDAIYSLNLTAWKRDWHLWGITPKLNFKWKKQDSNFSSLYSYTDKSMNILFEKAF
ncbi:surface lipoprotein assembly modifier [Ursidibacter arcticus]